MVQAFAPAKLQAVALAKPYEATVCAAFRARNQSLARASSLSLAARLHSGIQNLHTVAIAAPRVVGTIAN
jgi:hypothetical protein